MSRGEFPYSEFELLNTVEVLFGICFLKQSSLNADANILLKMMQYRISRDEYRKNPYVYDWKMRANFARGYWEIELFITREIEIPSKYQLHYCQKKRSDELKNNS